MGHLHNFTHRLTSAAASSAPRSKKTHVTTWARLAPEIRVTPPVSTPVQSHIDAARCGVGGSGAAALSLASAAHQLLLRLGPAVAGPFGRRSWRGSGAPWHRAAVVPRRPPVRRGAAAAHATYVCLTHEALASDGAVASAPGWGAAVVQHEHAFDVEAKRHVRDELVRRRRERAVAVEELPGRAARAERS